MTWLTIAVTLLVAQQAPVSKPQPRENVQQIAIQVALDRAGFSPGVIDGRPGANTERALAAFRQENGGDPDPFAEPLLKIGITEQDAAGPFAAEIPDDLIEQSKLPALDYRSVVEMLAERFHTDEKVLRALNPGCAFAAGDEVLVPNVEPMVVPTPVSSTSPARHANVVRVSRAAAALSVVGPDEKIVFFAPVTTGSEHDPLPIGEWKVNGVQFNPVFRYNPELFWDAEPSHTKAQIPAGPNNPVGLVWIDISKPHYGLHGSPEPARIGRTASHGCVRLTNWDALRLAALVQPGTRVVFTE